MPLANRYQSYQQTAAQTAGPEQLLLMSYDAIVRWLGRAEQAIEANRVQDAHLALIAAQDIVRDLSRNLDHTKGGDIAQNLAAIYDYVARELVLANVEKSVERIVGIKDLIRPLHDAWKVAVVKARRELGPSAMAGFPSA